VPSFNTYCETESCTGVQWFDGRRIYNVDVMSKTVTVFDVTGKTRWVAPFSLPSQITGYVDYRGLLINASRTRNGMCLDTLFTSNEYEIARIIFDVDNSAQTVNTELVWLTTHDAIDGFTYKSTVIYPDLAVISPYSTLSMVYVDLDSGSCTEVPFDFYPGDLDSVIVCRSDDVYLLSGGASSFRAYKLYSKAYETIPDSDLEGETAQANTAVIASLSKRLLLAATGVAYAFAPSPLVWFNERLNVIGRTSLTGIYQYPKPYGMVFLGVNGVGNYVLLASIMNMLYPYASDYGIYMLEIDPYTFSLVSYTKFADIKIKLDVSSPESKYYCIPILDRTNKKVYLVARYTVPPRVIGEPSSYQWIWDKIYLAEIDFSDVDIIEYNNYMHEVGVFKTPTRLSLKYTLL